MYDAILAESVTITGHGGDAIEAYAARPMGPGPAGGVVVIHHMPGYDAPTKEIARNFATHGYNAVVPNLYFREAPGASPDGQRHHSFGRLYQLNQRSRVRWGASPGS